MLILGIFAWLNTSSGKNFLKNRIVAFLGDKLKTEVYIGTLDYRLPKMIELKDVLFKDQAKDTMLAVSRLRVDISMLKLLKSQVEVQEIQMEGGNMHIYRNAPDTSFNFDYVVKAFVAPPDPNAQDAPTDSSGQFQLDIKQLVLDNIRFRMDDYTGGSRFATNVNHLELRLNKIDPYNMDFRADDLDVNGLSAVYIMDKSLLPPSTDTAAAPMPYLEAKELNLRNISFRYEDRVSPMLMEYQIGTLIGHPKHMDLANQQIAINDIKLDSTTARIVMGRVAADKAAKVADTLIDTDPAPAAKWYVTVNTLQFSRVNFMMDDESQPKQPYGIDYAHLDARNLNLSMNDLVYTTDTITGDIQHFAVQEQSGLDIQELKTNFAYYPQGAYLRDLYLKTPNTVLQDYIEVKYPSLAALQTRMESLRTRIHLTNSVVGMHDVLLFAPQLRSQPLFRTYGNDRIKLEAIAEGFVNDLDINRFIMQGLNSYVDISGNIKGLPDPNKISYNLSIAQLQSNKTVINTFLPSAMQKQVNLPNTFSITGRVSGTAQDYNTDLYATTSDGNLRIKGTLSMSPGAGRERYNMVVHTDRLNIGKIIRQEQTMGRISADITAVGQSFDVNYMNAMLKGNIHSAAFMGYAYRNISFKADVAKKAADVNVLSRDPNAMLDMTGNVSFRNKYPAVVAHLNVDSANLQALKLYPDEFRFRGVIDANIPVLNPDYPDGTVTIDRPTVVLKGTRYFLDSMYVVSHPSADTGNYIVVNADAVQAVITGHTPLTQIGNIVQSHINRHYALNRQDSIRAVRAAPASYDLQVNAILRDRPLMYVLLPGLQSMDTVSIQASLSPNKLFANVAAPRLQYSNMLFENAAFQVNGGDTGLNYTASVDRFSQNSLQFWYSSVSGSLYQKKLSANVSIADSSHAQRFGLSAILNQNGNSQELTVQDNMVLNYKSWQVSQPNRIVLGKDGFYVQNFRISNGGESISLNSEAPQFSAPLSVAINNFLISNVTEIISKDTLLANGVLNGNITASQLMTAPKVTGNLSVNNLSVLNDTVGDVTAQLNSASANSIDARVNITGRGNNVTVNGAYYPQPVNGNNFDMNINIAALNLVSFEGLTNYQIRNSSGYIRGNLKLQGTMAQPHLTGQLRTDNLGTTISALGSHFMMPSEVIEFTGDGIAFRNFKIVDSFGNVAMVDGKILTRDFKNMELDMRVRANRWQALNSTAKDNDLFYGKAIISTNMRITGTTLAPVVEGNLTVHDSTKFTVVVPTADPTIQDREGIVEFVDKSDPNRYKLLAPKDTTPTLGLRTGANINMNVAIEKNAEFNVIIDQNTGDFVRVRGTGSFNTALNPDGTVGIVGTYELNQGFYELNYNFIRRRFDIQPGSTITFAGDPLDATLNLTAVYTANIPPYDLVAQQVSDPTQLVYFKQRLPFQVQLKLTGQLMQPIVGFDISLPENRNFRATADVVNMTEARLAEIRTDASELNKQVFAVLILGRFIGENPFESGAGGGGAAFVAKQSASRFISDQLNTFADQLIKGVELNFNLETSEDYTTGERRERTDLSVSASRRLLNDRLKVTLGNDFGLAGSGTQTNASNTSLVPGNITLDYMLTPEGRYTLRLYRQNDTRELLDRNVTETGSSFIVRADYNRFRQLFIRKRKMMERRMRNQQWKERPLNDTLSTTAIIKK